MSNISKLTKVSNNDLIPYIKDICAINTMLPMGRGREELKDKYQKEIELLENSFWNLQSLLQQTFVEYKVNSSWWGAGRRSEVPWIMISNPNVTTKATKGYYVVVLFSGVEQAITISLAFAWTQIESKFKNQKPLNKLNEYRVKIKEQLDKHEMVPSFAKNYSADSPSLGTSQRSRAYIAGTLYCKHIKFNEFNNANIIGAINDLLMINDAMYERVFGVVELDDEKFLNSINEGKSLNSAVDESLEDYIKGIDYSRIQMNVPCIVSNATNKSIPLRTNNIIARELFDAKQKNKQTIGDQGEIIVKNKERFELTQNNRTDLANSVEILETHGDGFDVKSFEVDGTPKYIEVKAVTHNSSTLTFYITSNEIARAKEIVRNGGTYYIYIVRNIARNKIPNIKIFKNPFGSLINDFSDLNPAFELVAQSYKIRIKIED